MSRNKILLMTASIFLLSNHADAAQTAATLTIHVVKKTYGDKEVKPFSGVGVFDLLRGDAKLDGAACPDRSGQRGEIQCTIPCQSTSDTMVVRIKPPSDQDALAGWVTPAPQDIQVSRCRASPTSVTMQYEDARLALNDLITSAGLGVSHSNGTDAVATVLIERWIDILEQDNLTTKIAESVETPTGKTNIVDIYRVATAAIKTPKLQSAKLSNYEREQVDALARWQVLSTSALLLGQVTTTLSPDQRAQFRFQPTTDVATYRASLADADLLLSKITTKNPAQLRLADDIKTLKSLPSTGKDASEAASIIEMWK